MFSRGNGFSSANPLFDTGGTIGFLCLIVMMSTFSDNVLVVNGLLASEIPRQTSYNNATDDCGRIDYPGNILEDCTEPLAEGVPDHRGWWQGTTIGQIEHIEQCGNRYVLSFVRFDYSTRWGIRDWLDNDGTQAGGFNDFVSDVFPDCLPVQVPGRYEGNCHIFTDLEVFNVNISRCLVGDVIVWDYFAAGTVLRDTLVRTDGPRVSTALFSVATNQRIGEFPTVTFSPDLGLLGRTIDLCQVGEAPLSIRAIAPGADEVVFELIDNVSGRKIFRNKDVEEPFFLGGDVGGQPFPVGPLNVAGNYTLVVMPSPGFSKVERPFLVSKCESTCEDIPFTFVVWDAASDTPVGPLADEIDLCRHPGGVSIEMFVPCGNAAKVKFSLFDEEGERVYKTTEGSAPYQLGKDIDTPYDVLPVDQFLEYPGVYKLKAKISFIEGGRKTTVETPVFEVKACS